MTYDTLPGEAQATQPRTNATRPNPSAMESADEDATITIFSLQFCDAQTAATLVRQLMPDVKLAEDIRTNSLIVIAKPRRLEFLTVLLQRLDVQTQDVHKQIQEEKRKRTHVEQSE